MKGGKPGPLWPWAKKLLLIACHEESAAKEEKLEESYKLLTPGLALAIYAKWTQYTGAMQKPKWPISLFLSLGNPNIYLLCK